jgi:predicted small integral membrane protein
VACALYWTVVVFNNLVDYGTNLEFVQHVLTMDTVRPINQTSWRAIHQPWMHHGLYFFIIAWETLATATCWLGAWRCARQRRASRAEFERSKSTSVVALTMVLLLFFCGFLTVGGEWYMMWQSQSWSGVDPAGRLFAIHALILLWLTQPEVAE